MRGALIALAAGAILAAAPAPAYATDVLILGTTTSVGESGSVESQEAAALGLTWEIADVRQWAAKTTADFAAYRAVVLGDPNCAGDTSPLDPAVANRAVWSAAIDGNVVVNVTDPSYHANFGTQGARTLVNRSIRLAAAEPDRTGLYASLGCSYNSASEGTPVPVLEGISGGGFQVRGTVGCANATHIVATHPALEGLTDAALSDWGCSTHGGFDRWPLDFEVLALSTDVPSSFVAPDGTPGAPYIVARGVAVVSDIGLAPESGSGIVGAQQSVTATVIRRTVPLANTDVTFRVVGGPHEGDVEVVRTGADGRAAFAYTGRAVGTDLIEATFASAGTRQRSNRVERTWSAPLPGADRDGDGVLDGQDNCPANANGDQADADRDGSGDACDPPTGRLADRDEDGVADDRDNCPSAANADQDDRDRDDIGDVCDTLPPGDQPAVAGRTTVATTIGGEVWVKLPVDTGTQDAGASRAGSDAGASRTGSEAAASRAGSDAGASRTGPGAHAAQAEPGFVPMKGIAALPVGTLVDARKGRLLLTSAADYRAPDHPRHRVQTGRFAAAIFAIRQARARRARARAATTTLALRTPRGKARACAARRTRPIKGIVRTFSATAKGRFATVGGASTTRTLPGRRVTWIVKDRCNGTVTEVGRGRARVFDRTLKDTVLVRAGRSYLARARLFGARRPR